VALAGSLVLWLGLGARADLVLLGYALPLFVAAAVAGELARATRGRMRATGEGAARAVRRLLRQNHRRYGGLIVHLGVVLVAVGVAASSVGKVEREATLRRGEWLELPPYRLRFEGLTASEQPTHVLVTAEMSVLEGERPVTTLRPGQRIYPASQSPFATVDIRYRPHRDLYLILGGFDRGGEWATVKAQIHPMIAWIWLGGVVVVLGGVLAVWPAPRRAGAPLPAAVPAATSR
jgi:cytochrome c-type biogenesis protein CcmF